MPLKAAATLGLLLSLALILSSCGEDRTSAAIDRPPSTAPNRTGDSRPESTPAPHQTPPQESCHAQLGPFIDSMATLRQRLAGGLDYKEYLRQVQDVRRVYHRVQPDHLGATCLLTSGAPAERALNLYIDAANTWGNCLATAGCTTASIEPKLQRKWAFASERLSKAEQASHG